MLTIYANGNKLILPQSFHELTHAQLQAIQSDPTPRGAIVSLTRLDINKVQLNGLDALLELVSFVFEPPEIMQPVPIQDVGDLPFGKELQARELIKGSQYPWLFALDICEIYGLEKKHDVGIQLISSIHDLYNTFAELHTGKEADPDYEAAGSERLLAFDKLMLIDQLADGEILKWKEVELLPARVAYTKLLMDKVKNEVNTNYEKIKRLGNDHT